MSETIGSRFSLVTRAARGTRPDIQTLRGIAVIAVLAYHLFPAQVRGGFVGVDVFFAISGYLIIGHLIRGLDFRGRVGLADFWARRARRLLPASLLVLVVSGVATYLFVPQVLWSEWFKELTASAAYVQNWLLATNAVDYLGADSGPSPSQHYWSLSVEEQLYIVWPLALVVIVALFGAARKRAVHIAIGVVLVVATLASLAYSIWDVAVDPAAAYFVTPARAWEFGAGGLLAYFAWLPGRRMLQLRTLAVWLGLAMIVAAVFLYSSTTPFPGATALLPVLGTLLVIWGDLPHTRWSPAVLLSMRPVTWIGDISYSLYLWHWPLIVLIPAATGTDLTMLERLLIVVVAVVLAALTNRFVEDPVRQSRPLLTRPAWVSLVACLGATVLVIGGGGASYEHVQSQILASGERIGAAVDSSTSNCIGAPAVLPGSGCTRPYAVTSLTNTAFAATDIGKGVQQTDSCKQTLNDSTVITCKVGDTTRPATIVALVGDSHMGQWVEALDAYGKSHSTQYVTYIKTLCAGTGADGVTSPNGLAASISSCTVWGRSVLRAVAKDPAISTVVFADFTQTYLTTSSVPGSRMITSGDFISAWEPLVAAGKKVVALRDTPNAGFVNVPQCVAIHRSQYDPCTTARTKALLSPAKDPLVTAAGKVPGVSLADPTSVFCGPTTCHSVIGGLVVFFDDTHMTATFSRTMSNVIGSALDTVAR